jgi:O-antigen/teichoic acid export membrane protein
MMRLLISSFKESIFLKNSFLLFSGSMLANVFNYVFHFAIGRMVTPQVYGEMEAIVSLLAIITVPGSALVIVATQYASRAKARNDSDARDFLFHYLNTKIFQYGFLAFCGALLFTPFVAQFLKIEHQWAVIFLWMMMFLSFFSSISIGILSGWQKFFWVGLINVVGAFSKLVFALIFVTLGFAVDGLIGSFLLASFVGYILSLYVLKQIRKKDSQREDGGKKEKTSSSLAPGTITLSAKKYVLSVFFASLALALLGNIDMVLAKYHLTPEEAGSYGALFIVSKIIFFVAGIVTSVMFAMSSEEHEKSALSGKNECKTFKKALILTLFFCTGSTLFFFLFPSFTLSVFFGKTYLHVSQYLGWFGLMVSLYTLSNFFLQYFLSIKEKALVWWILGVALLEIPILFFWGQNLVSLMVLVLVTQGISLIVSLSFFFKKRYTRRYLEKKTSL